MTWEKVKRAKARHEEELLRRPNVVGLAIGKKIVGGWEMDEPCVAVLVRTKVPEAELEPQDLVPPTIDDVVTDVVETGEIEALAVRGVKLHRKSTTRWRPAPGGVSVGHFRVTAGTLGCIVWRGSERFILSNNHILADSNRGRKGHAILQPASMDGGKESEDTIALLEDYVPLKWSGGFLGSFLGGFLGRLLPFKKHRNRADCAIAKPLREGDVADEIHLVGRPEETVEAYVDQRVLKSGRTTGLTKGEVTHIDATLNVSYGEGRSAVFEGQVLASKMSDAGDSGSVVVDRQRRAVGLLFAGSETVSVFSEMQDVLSLLKVEI